MQDIAKNLLTLRHRIHEFEQRYGRESGSVSLLAVSKTRSPAELQTAIANGQTMFGESYAQEAMAKMAAINDLGVSWHFIGPVQSNKTRVVAEQFTWVHSVDRARIARRLAKAVPQAVPPLNVCIQVNISAEPGKSGIQPHELPELVAEISRYERLRLRGLMAMPAPAADVSSQRKAFAALRDLYDGLHAGFPEMDTLSMGTSADMEAAIAEGSTLVRIGTAVFGPRE